MAAQIGIVYYADDPDKKVFRRVQESYAGEFDDPARLDAIKAEQTTFGVDPARTAVMEMVEADDSRNVLSGTPSSPPTTDGVAEDAVLVDEAVALPSGNQTIGA